MTIINVPSERKLPREVIGTKMLSALIRAADDAPTFKYEVTNPGSNWVDCTQPNPTTRFTLYVDKGLLRHIRDLGSDGIFFDFNLERKYAILKGRESVGFYSWKKDFKEFMKNFYREL